MLLCFFLPPPSGLDVLKLPRVPRSLSGVLVVASSPRLNLENSCKGPRIMENSRKGPRIMENSRQGPRIYFLNVRMSELVH